MLFLKKLFKTKVSFNIAAPTIPDSLGYSLDKFDALTTALFNCVDDNNKVVTFAAFINNPRFKEFGLDLRIPNHAAVLGYALCAAIVLKHNIQTRHSAEEVLKVFYPPLNNASASKDN